MKCGFLGTLTMALVLVGAINWGLVGFFNYDLVASLFGAMSTPSKVVYDAVGISAVYQIILLLTGKYSC